MEWTPVQYDQLDGIWRRSIMNDGSVTISTVTSSDNTFTTNFQFTYLMEGDEGI